ncbi:hypothetical protein NEISUBOT_03980 [Neisseria subflava NJ9703]|uniref:Uncharacterized protein n=1 Tax=Neisseria subflava NJ9703 TaxID=546268 RepID=A0A9W5MZW6_NEISU|nr:hypothetical protein NEISUBOT_03980 [Neisseria subflava NJ9703]
MNKGRLKPIGISDGLYYLSCISTIFCFKPSFATIILIIILIIKCFQTA